MPATSPMTGACFFNHNLCQLPLPQPVATRAYFFNHNLCLLPQQELCARQTFTKNLVSTTAIRTCTVAPGRCRAGPTFKAQSLQAVAPHTPAQQSRAGSNKAQWQWHLKRPLSRPECTIRGSGRSTFVASANAGVGGHEPAATAKCPS